MYTSVYVGPLHLDVMEERIAPLDKMAKSSSAVVGQFLGYRLQESVAENWCWSKDEGILRQKSMQACQVISHTFCRQPH